MIFKKLGKSNLTVSKICFGSLTLGPLQKNMNIKSAGAIVRYAFEKGVNFIDTAELYQTYDIIRNALDSNSDREKIVISSKTYAYTKNLAVKAVEDARKSLNRDVIDIFMLHEQESIHTLQGHKEALEQLIEYKHSGIIKAVGVSTHHVATLNGVLEDEFRNCIDVVHPIYNYKGFGIADGTIAQMTETLEKIHKQNIGIFSMKPFGGGNLLNNASECLNFVLDKPFIDSVAIGMSSIDEVDLNIEFLEKRTFDKINISEKYLHIDSWCTKCGNCVKNCSFDALKIENDALIYNKEKCSLCGYCGAFCPQFALKII